MRPVVFYSGFWHGFRIGIIKPSTTATARMGPKFVHFVWNTVAFSPGRKNDYSINEKKEQEAMGIAGSSR